MKHQKTNKQGVGYKVKGKSRAPYTLNPISYTLRGGYTLLFAVLVAALVLGVAVFILDVSTKQYELSAAARESIYSFYAADSGIECVALNGPSGNGTSNVYNWMDSSNTITCGNSSSIPVIYTNYGPPGYQYQSGLYDLYATTTTFSLEFLNPKSNRKACAVVTIIEYHDNSSGNNNVYHDLVQSRGYNYCATGNNSWGNNTWGPDTTNPATVERALQLSHFTD